MQDIQVPAFRPGGGVDEDRIGRDRAGNREREVLLPGGFLLLGQDRTFPEEEDAAHPVLAVQTHFQYVQPQLFRQGPGLPLLGLLLVRQAVFPQPVGAGFDLILPQDGHQEPVQLPEAAVRLVLRQVQLLYLKGEPVLGGKPEGEAEAETDGKVPVFLFHGEGDAQVNVRQEVRPVQAPAGDGTHFHLPGLNPL